MPPPPFVVRIIDQSAEPGDEVVEDIGPFPSLAGANAFARRYVRDSVERCRARGMTAAEVLDAWRLFGEDARVPDAPEGESWTSEAELPAFAANRAPAAERDWRSLDPRLDGPEDEDDDDAPGDDAADGNADEDEDGDEGAEDGADEAPGTGRGRGN